MCAGAIVQCRMGRVVIGAMNAKAGCAGSVLNILQMPQFNHQVEMETGVLEEECSTMLSQFFRELREKKKQQQPINNNNSNNNEKYVTKKDYYVYHDENGESYYFYHKRGKVFIGHAKVAEGDLPAEFIGVEIAKRKAYIKEKKDRALETRKVIRHYESIAKAQEKAIKKAQKDLNSYLKDIDDKMALIIKIRRKRENESDID